MFLKENFVFILLAFFTTFVNCDESVFVVQAPEETTKQFKVYWNAPTKQCIPKGIQFNDLFEKFGIIQNTADLFDRGDSVAILYDPGFFPLITNNDGNYTFRNEGVPNEGNLTEHLIKLQERIEDYIPDADYNGIAILDQESWRPIYRWHWGGLAHYKDIIIEIERNRSCSSLDAADQDCCANEQCLKDKATAVFEAGARVFMESSLSLAKTLRPKAQWGYYGYPFCFNRETDECDAQTMGENEQLEWLWKDSTALFPSVYPTISLSSYLEVFIRGSINEAARIKDLYSIDVPILPYWWYHYRDGDFYTKEELNLILDTFYYSDASGFVIWGASSDMANADKCEALRQYVYETLGPAIAGYTKPGSTAGGSEVEETINITTTIEPQEELITTTAETDVVTSSAEISLLTTTLINTIIDTTPNTEANTITDTTVNTDTTTNTDVSSVIDATTVMYTKTTIDIPSDTDTSTIMDASEITTAATTEADTIAKPETISNVTKGCSCENVTNTPIWIKEINDTCDKGASVVETVVKETYVKEMKVTETIVKNTCDGSDLVKETKINESFTKESSVKETTVKETFSRESSCGNVTIETCNIKNNPSISINNSDKNETCNQETAEPPKSFWDLSSITPAGTTTEIINSTTTENTEYLNETTINNSNTEVNNINTAVYNTGTKTTANNIEPNYNTTTTENTEYLNETTKDNTEVNNINTTVNNTKSETTTNNINIEPNYNNTTTENTEYLNTTTTDKNTQVNYIHVVI